MENYNDEYGAEYSVPFASIIEEFKLEVIHIPEGKKVKITRTSTVPDWRSPAFLNASTTTGFS